MATVNYTFAFASDAQGLVDRGNHASVGFGFLGTDGNPSGCVRFTCTTKSLSGAIEYGWHADSQGISWEDMGVPAGATVTNVQIVGWDKKLAAASKLSSHSLFCSMIENASLNSILSGGLISPTLGTIIDSSWQAGAAPGPLRNVLSSYQASNTIVRFYIQYTITTLGGGGQANVDQRFDNIVLQITYTPASTADADAEVAWTEVEVPFANATAQVAWAEVEVPTANSSAHVAWAELEVPTANANAEVSFAEVETPSLGPVDANAEIAWVEVEVPTAEARAEVSWTEVEISTAPARADVSWAEVEVPFLPTWGELSWAEFEVPLAPAQVELSFAEVEVPTAGSSAQIAWVELEVPTASACAEIAHTQFEVPDIGGPAYVWWQDHAPHHH